MKIRSVSGVRVERVGFRNLGKFSNATGSLPQNIKHFQDWMDKVHPNWLNDGTNLNKNVSKGYGNGGAQTQKAYSMYGTAYESALQGLMGNLGGMFGTGSTTTSSSTSPSVSTTVPSTISQTDPAGNKKAGMLWDKTKNTWVKGNDWINAHPELSNTVKGLIGNMFNKVKSGEPVFKSGTGILGKGLNYTKNDPEPVVTEKSKMGTGAKVGLVIGGVALLAIAAFVIIKKTKSKK